jgi:GH15 family glucan-1,4-alpha-glucosidase
MTACLEVTIASIDRVAVPWEADGSAHIDGRAVRVLGADRLAVDGATLIAEVALDGVLARPLLLCVDCDAPSNLETAVRDRQEEWHEVARRARLPHDHPSRAVDALRALTACTFAPTGAVIAAPTTSVPEAPGGERNWDYRYCWLRDASIAASVASQLGLPAAGARYLDFVCRRTSLGQGHIEPVVSVTGGPVPVERELELDSWSGAAPARIGNEAAQQRQLDAVGFLGEALWTHRVSGGSISPALHDLVDRLAEHCLERPGPTNGIWELRTPALLVSAELGRWLLLDRALKLRRLRRPWRRPPSRWRAARQDAAARVQSAISPEGWLPIAFEGALATAPDAAGLLAVITGLLDPREPAATKLVDSTIAALGEGPFLRRYPEGTGDGFSSREGTFVPVSWWAVSALATLGRVDEAAARADALCEALPSLLPEEWEPSRGEPRGNLPLVWSHIEAGRALFVLQCARIGQRWGRAGLAAWKLWRYAYVKVTPG